MLSPTFGQRVNICDRNVDEDNRQTRVQLIPYLNNACAVRLDGTMNAVARQASIDQFQTDKETCVFRERIQ
jgi:hypothetical protein